MAANRTKYLGSNSDMHPGQVQSDLYWPGPANTDHYSRDPPTFIIDLIATHFVFNILMVSFRAQAPDIYIPIHADTVLRGFQDSQHEVPLPWMVHQNVRCFIVPLEANSYICHLWPGEHIAYWQHKRRRRGEQHTERNPNGVQYNDIIQMRYSTQHQTYRLRYY